MHPVITAVTARLPSVGTRDGAVARTTVFELLRNRRRRYALHYLKQQASPVQISRLAKQVAAWEYETPVAEVSRQERHRVYVSLTQTHLPKMSEEGIVRIDEPAGTVRLTDQAAALTVYLEVIPDTDIAWPQFYAGVAVVNAGLLAVAALELPVLREAPTELWMIAIAVVFLLAAGVHNWFQRKGRLGTAGPPPE